MSDLIRVQFDYSDGTYKYITGEQLEKWNKFNAQVAQLAYIHGMNPNWEEIEWKEAVDNKPDRFQ